MKDLERLSQAAASLFLSSDFSEVAVAPDTVLSFAQSAALMANSEGVFNLAAAIESFDYREHLVLLPEEIATILRQFVAAGVVAGVSADLSVRFTEAAWLSVPRTNSGSISVSRISARSWRHLFSGTRSDG